MLNDGERVRINPGFPAGPPPPLLHSHCAGPSSAAKLSGFRPAPGVLTCSPSSSAELIDNFKSQMKANPDTASAVAAIRTLLEFLKRDKGTSGCAGCWAELGGGHQTLPGLLPLKEHFRPGRAHSHPSPETEEMLLQSLLVTRLAWRPGCSAG